MLVELGVKQNKLISNPKGHSTFSLSVFMYFHFTAYNMYVTPSYPFMLCCHLAFEKDSATLRFKNVRPLISSFFSLPIGLWTWNETKQTSSFYLKGHSTFNRSHSLFMYFHFTAYVTLTCSCFRLTFKKDSARVETLGH